MDIATLLLTAAGIAGVVVIVKLLLLAAFDAMFGDK